MACLYAYLYARPPKFSSIMYQVYIRTYVQMVYADKPLPLVPGGFEAEFKSAKRQATVGECCCL